MPQPPPSLPSSPSAPPEPAAALALKGGDLDERIRAAEGRLVAREAGLRSGWLDLQQRTRGQLSPRAWAPWLAGGVGGVALLWWAGRRPASAGPRAAPARPEASGPGRADLPWVQWVGLVWPLLPAPWRARVSPAAAAAVTSVGLPLLQQLLQPERRAFPALGPLPKLAPGELTGTWQVRAWLPGRPGRADRAPPDLQVRSAPDGLRVGAAGPGAAEPAVVARPVPGSEGARWQVSAWPAPLRLLPWAWREQAVLVWDAPAGLALVGSLDRQRLRLLARAGAAPSPADLRPMLERAAALGYDLSRLRGL